MQGGRGADWSGIPGGKFSLGRLKAGSGYCVGAVVETRMGMKGENGGGIAGGENGWMGKSRGTLAGNGMRDVWVIGEGFFRGVGAVFDVGRPFVSYLENMLTFLLMTVSGTESRLPYILIHSKAR